MLLAQQCRSVDLAFFSIRFYFVMSTILLVFRCSFSSLTTSVAVTQNAVVNVKGKVKSRGSPAWRRSNARDQALGVAR